MITPIVDLYRGNRAVGTPKNFPIVNATPNEFMRRKFPETSAEEIQELVGRDARKVSWNTFIITAR